MPTNRETGWSDKSNTNNCNRQRTVSCRSDARPLALTDMDTPQNLDSPLKGLPTRKYDNITSTDDPALKALPTDSLQERAEKIVAWGRLRDNERQTLKK